MYTTPAHLSERSSKGSLNRWRFFVSLQIGIAYRGPQASDFGYVRKGVGREVVTSLLIYVPNPGSRIGDQMAD